MPTQRTNSVHIIIARANEFQRVTTGLDRRDAVNQALTERHQASEHHARNDAQIAVFAQATPAVWQIYLNTLVPDERQVVETHARHGERSS